jgi:uncharacterized Ntn-hydrolase superfamily protein
MFGIAIASSSPAVAARCAHARAGVGAVASQNMTDPALGPGILDLLANGSAAPEALANSLSATQFGAYRQLIVVAAAGAPAVHSGAHSLGVAATAIGAHCAAAGNLLAQREVPAAMVSAFEAADGHFGGRLLQGLLAGLKQGGEAGPIHSAGLLIVREVKWPIVDLRVDWCEQDPVTALAALWARYQPQIEDYVQRALDPAHAPNFAVPGNRR